MKPIQITMVSVSLPKPYMFIYTSRLLPIIPISSVHIAPPPRPLPSVTENIILTQESLVKPLQPRLSGVATSKDCKHVITILFFLKLY